jgi:hypothetical protein
MTAAAGGRCPTCHGDAPAAPGAGARWFPFCSRRCQLADLGRWLDEDYRISEPLAPDPEAEPPRGRGR